MILHHERVYRCIKGCVCVLQVMRLSSSQVYVEKPGMLGFKLDFKAKSAGVAPWSLNPRTTPMKRRIQRFNHVFNHV